MSVRDRLTHYPSWYRVCFRSVAGLCSYDVNTIEEARRRAKAERGYILAVWECVPEDGGRTYIDTELVR